MIIMIYKKNAGAEEFCSEHKESLFLLTPFVKNLQYHPTMEWHELVKVQTCYSQLIRLTACTSRSAMGSADTALPRVP